MSVNLPSATQWNALCKKHALNDNGVQKALAAYERIGDDKPAQRAAALDEVAKLAGALKQSKEAKANAAAGKAIDVIAVSAKAESKAHGAAAEKAKTAEKQKPDPARAKTLLTALRKVGKLPDVNAGGSAGAKDARALPCNAEKEKADIEFLKLDVAVVSALAGGGPGAMLGLLGVAMGGCDAFIAALNKWLDCLRAHRNPQTAAVETRLRQVRELRGGLQREREQIDRWNRMFG